MRNLFLICSLIAISQAHIFAVPAPVAVTGSDPVKCLQIFYEIVAEAYKLIGAIKEGDHSATQKLFMDITIKLAQEYECLNKADLNDLLKTLMQVASQFQNDKKDCYLDHLQKASDKFRDGLFALFHGRFDEFNADVSKVVDILQDAIQNC